MMCADALNKKFVMGVSVDQVDRQYRQYKENWKFVAAAFRKSGNAFDHTRCLVTISDSEKEHLCDRARRLLSKPVKFFEEMQELFQGSSADGSLAMDQNTCTEVSDNSDSDDSIEFHGYTQHEEVHDDSDTLPTSSRRGDHSSSSNTRGNKKRARRSDSPTKKPLRNKNQLDESNEEITATMKCLREILVSTAPPQMSQFTDPHASLWKKLEAIPLTPDQCILLGEHLSSKDNKDKRGWLCNVSDETLNAWVFKFLCDKDGI